MTGSSYTKALEQVLQPLGFERAGKDRVRMRGDIWDCVNLQKSWVDGSVTVNLYAKDLEALRTGSYAVARGRGRDVRRAMAARRHAILDRGR